jgi:hypothetical protein
MALYMMKSPLEICRGAMLSTSSAAHHPALAGSHQETVVYRPAPERQGHSTEDRHIHNRRGAPHNDPSGGANRNTNVGHGPARDEKPPTLSFPSALRHNANNPAGHGTVCDETPLTMLWLPVAPHHHAPAGSH